MSSQPGSILGHVHTYVKKKIDLAVSVTFFAHSSLPSTLKWQNDRKARKISSIAHGSKIWAISVTAFVAIFKVLFVTRASLKNWVQVKQQVRVLKSFSHDSETPEITWQIFAHPVWPVVYPLRRVLEKILFQWLKNLILCLNGEKTMHFCICMDMLLLSLVRVLRELLPSGFP